MMSPAPQSSFENETMSYANDLFGFAMSLVRNRTDAEDLVQETLLKACRSKDQFEKGTRLKSWLFTILRNTFINSYRKKKRESTSSIEDEADFSMYGEVYDAVEKDSAYAPLEEQPIINPQKLGEVMGDEVLLALNALSEEYREVLFFSDVQELPYQAIADILNIPIGTVRSRLARARGALQKSLWKYAQQNGLLRRKAS